MKPIIFLRTVAAAFLSMSFALSANAELGGSIGIGLSVQTGDTYKTLDTNDPLYSNSYEHQLSQLTNRVIERAGYDDHGNLITYYLHDVAEAVTSASLYTGQFKAIAKASPPVQFFGPDGSSYLHNFSQALTTAQMNDVLHFQVPLGQHDSSGFAYIPITLEFEGGILADAEAYGWADYRVNLGSGEQILLQNTIARDAAGNLYPWSGMNAYWGSTSNPLTTSDNIHWNATLQLHTSNGIISGNDALYTLNFGSSFATSAAGSFVAYGNTAGISFDLPEDVLLTSDSGVFLTAAAVPEPETYAMLLAGLGMLGFTAKRRKSA